MKLNTNKKEKEMITKDGKQVYEHANPNNGGRERTYIKDGKFWISSDFGMGFGEIVPVSKSDLLSALRWTNAPADFIERIKGM